MSADDFKANGRRRPNSLSDRGVRRRARRLGKAHDRRVRQRVFREARRLCLDLRRGYVCIESVPVDEEQIAVDDWVNIYQGEMARYREGDQGWGGTLIWANRPEAWSARR